MAIRASNEVVPTVTNTGRGIERRRARWPPPDSKPARPASRARSLSLSVAAPAVFAAPPYLPRAPCWRAACSGSQPATLDPTVAAVLLFTPSVALFRTTACAGWGRGASGRGPGPLTLRSRWSGAIWAPGSALWRRWPRRARSCAASCSSAGACVESGPQLRRPSRRQLRAARHTPSPPHPFVCPTA